MFGQNVLQPIQTERPANHDLMIIQSRSDFESVNPFYSFPPAFDTTPYLHQYFLSKRQRSESCLGVSQFCKTGSISGFVLKRKPIP